MNGQRATVGTGGRSGAQVLRVFLQIVLRLTAAVLLLSPLGLWFAAEFVRLAAGSGEYRSIRDTGLPGCEKILIWSNWIKGSDGLTRGHIREDIPEDAEIMAYRIASKSAIATEYTFYQAKYRLTDGSVRIGHADGPKPLIDHNWTVLYAAIGIAVPIAFVLLVIASRLRPSPR